MLIKAGSLDRRGSMAAWISRRLAQSRVDAVTGRQRGGRRDEHCDRQSGEVISHRDGGVGEQAGCLLDQSAAQA
jgi:hypothetical protein